MKITKSCALLLMLESGNDEHKKAGFAHLSLVKLKKKKARSLEVFYIFPYYL